MLPTGEQIAIAHGDQRATITEVGGTLRTYVKAGVAVVEGFAAEELPDGSRNHLSFPWPGALGEGAWTFSDRVAHPRLDDATHLTAHDGLTRWRPFKVLSINQNRCSLGLTLHPVPEFPFLSEMRVDYHLGPNGLTTTTTVTNIDEVPLPFGLGFHPLTAVTTPSIEGAVLTVPAKAFVEINERGLPTGSILPVSGHDVDFREGKSVNGHNVKHVFAELLRDDTGMCVVTVADAAGGVVEVAMDRNFPYVAVNTNDDQPVGQRRTGISLTPMTCPPDALRSGKDLVVLEPGQHWAASWRLRRLS